MIDQTPAATLVLMGDNLVIEQINIKMLEFIGRSDKIIGQPLIAVLPELEGQYVWEQVKKVYHEGIAFDQNEVLVPHNRTGTIKNYYYNLAYRPLIENGKITGMIQVAIDVTEQVEGRKQLEESERRFREMLLQAPVAATLFQGRDLIIEIANELTLKYWGKDASIIGKSVAEAAPELEDQQVIALLKDRYEKGGTVSFSEAPITFIENGVSKDGYYSFSIKALYGNDGEVESLLSIGVDVSEQVEARKKLEESENHFRILSETLEQQVNKRTKELQRSNEDLQQFAHVASHDLKEPIRKIKTFIGRLEQEFDGKLSDTGTRYIERIHVATAGMFNMIDGVLAYSTTNASTHKIESVNLNEVIKNIETDLELALQETGGTIMHSDLPTLEGALVLLYQLFYNLINNSIKFAKEGIPPQITITSTNIFEHDESFSKIILADNGIGFEPEHANRIFETFSRLNSKDSYEGTGLGLSLCKKIVERHGGSIIADGSSDKGAAFTIILPLQQKGTSV
ncbi:sensor histidine kinase [Flavobacterium sp. 3HN19-14]|uniref:sensor histidine kinase n=1 Tax=Flavobacterium sp. 3HN19-14 TaxID=3448133 RepID=UPI003EE25D2E